MKRRDFVTLLGSFAGTAAVARPLLAWAQQPAAPGVPKEPASDPAFAKAASAVDATLKDPQSARYADMVMRVGPHVNGKPAQVVCGSVEAKDPSGKYAKRRFVYFTADGATFVGEPNAQSEDVAQLIYRRFCK